MKSLIIQLIAIIRIYQLNYNVKRIKREEERI